MSKKWEPTTCAYPEETDMATLSSSVVSSSLSSLVSAAVDRQAMSATWDATARAVQASASETIYE